MTGISRPHPVILAAPAFFDSDGGASLLLLAAYGAPRRHSRHPSHYSHRLCDWGDGNPEEQRQPPVTFPLHINGGSR